MKLPALDELSIPLFRCDAAGHLVHVNDAWRSSFPTDLGESWHAPFPDLDASHHGEFWTRCTSTPEALNFSTRGPDGDAPTWYELVLQPYEDDAGSVSLLGTLIDVSQHRIAAAESHAILDTAVDAIIIIEEDGRIQTFNQAAGRMFGHDPRSMINQPVTMLMPEAHASAHSGYIRNYLTSGEARVIGIGRELEGVRADGTRIPIYLAVSEIRLGNRTRFAGIIRDLTEQHMTREALAEQREKLAHVGRLSTMGEMTASIAHEINQPLTAITMYAQASKKLLDQGADPDRISAALDKLNTQALRAGAVIERIQRFAQAQDSVREFVDINALVQDLLKLAGSDARLHAMTLELELGEALPELWADPVQLQQVVLNLIRNAIDAMNEIRGANGDAITISTSLEAGLDGAREIEVAVADQGPGVAEDQTNLLFTPFHTTKKDGMGMGLSICRSIIRDHGGELSFRNNSADPGTDGCGATFFFRIPVESGTD